MANEVSINFALAINKSGIASGITKNNLRDLVGTNQISHVQTVGTSEEALVFGDLDNVAHLALHNLGEVPVTISLDDSGAQVLCVLAPGDVAYLPSPSDQLYAATASGESDLAVVACET